MCIWHIHPNTCVFIIMFYPFVSNSLSYITWLKTTERYNLTPMIKLNHNITLLLACSRLLDSGEDEKEKGTRKVVGVGKSKKEGEQSQQSFLLQPSSAHFWHV